MSGIDTDIGHFRSVPAKGEGEGEGGANPAGSPGGGPRRDVLRQKIGVRLLALIILFSSTVTLISTLSQLYIDYRQQVGSIEVRMGEIEKSYAGSLAAGLWNVDADQLQLQLDGIVHLSDMRFAQVREIATGGTKPLVVSAGQVEKHLLLVREVPLTFTAYGVAHQVGSFKLEATLDDVYDRLINTAIIILTSQGIKTFLVSMFTLYVFHRLVTRHLIAIAGFLDNHDSRSVPPQLVLERSEPSHPDELDRMVGAFNSMSVNLYASNHELAGVNAELERDIAIRLTKEQELQKTIQDLVEANMALDRFAYIASHDLQEPLRSITSFVQLLAKRYAGKLDHEADEYIEFTVAAAKRMYDLINDLLVFSRVDSRAAKFTAVSSRSACEAALQNLHETITESGADISVGDQPGVKGDAIQLMEVFQNLIGNGIKFHRAGVPPSISVTAQPEGDQWRFAIADNGIGIPPGQPDIFEIFRRLHTVVEFPGTGIGLAICKTIIQRHNGRIWFTSAPGAGTTFFFTLPRD